MTFNKLDRSQHSNGISYDIISRKDIFGLLNLYKMQHVHQVTQIRKFKNNESHVLVHSGNPAGSSTL
jgi:hypothetical protein